MNLQVKAKRVRIELRYSSADKRRSLASSRSGFDIYDFYIPVFDNFDFSCSICFSSSGGISFHASARVLPPNLVLFESLFHIANRLKVEVTFNLFAAMTFYTVLFQKGFNLFRKRIGWLPWMIETIKIRQIINFIQNPSTNKYTLQYIMLIYNI